MKPDAMWAPGLLHSHQGFVTPFEAFAAMF
jgi:hypothetical protein